MECDARPTVVTVALYDKEFLTTVVVATYVLLSIVVMCATLLLHQCLQRRAGNTREQIITEVQSAMQRAARRRVVQRDYDTLLPEDLEEQDQ